MAERSAVNRNVAGSSPAWGVLYGKGVLAIPKAPFFFCQILNKGINMTNFIIMIVIIVVGVYFKNKYNREYALPIIEENADLSFVNKFSLIMLLIAGLCAFINTKLMFFILIGLIPFVLYLNFKTSWLAFTKKNKNKF